MSGARTIKGRIITMIVTSWLVPAILLVYYFDTNNRTRDEFERGLMYSAELTGERLKSAVDWAENIGADAFFETRERPPGVLFGAIEPNSAKVLDFSGGSAELFEKGAGDYETAFYSEDFARYAGQDRAGLMHAMEAAGGKPLFYISPGGRFYVARWLFADYEGLKRRTSLFVVALDEEYIFSYLLENSFGSKSLDVELNGVCIRFEKSEYTIEESRDTRANDVSGSIGEGAAGFRYGAVMDKQALINNYFVMTILYYSLFLVCPLLVILSFSLYRSVSVPIGRLMDAINAINRGGFGVKVDESSNNEFSRLGHAFNVMSSSLSDALEREKEKETASREARLLALRAQINPHFINNTLEFLNWKARMNDADGVSAMVEALSVLLEGAMGREGASLLPLKKELSYARAYLDVIKMRFGDRVKISADIDDEALGCLVPPLILQPLLENAVVHGIEPRTDGAVDIAARYDAENGLLTLTVINDGALSDAQKESLNLSFAKDSGTKRLGVRNVAERLHLIFGEKAGFCVYGEGGRTAARITLPFEKAADGD